MCLLVGDHLQAMLETAEIAIGVIKIGADISFHPAAVLKRGQRIERRADAQVGLASAGDQLLGLGEKFDLADAATAELQVLSGNRDRADVLVRVDLPLHGMDVGDRCKIQILAPNERREFGQKFVAGADIASDGPRLDQRRPLPILAHGLVVAVRRHRRESDLSGAGVRTKAQVGSENVTVRGALIEQKHEVTRQADEEGLQIAIANEAGFIAVEKNGQVDVARIVQFEGTMLAHRKHEVTRLSLRAFGYSRLPLAARRCHPKQETNGRADGGIGAIRQRARYGHHGPEASQIGERGQKRHLGLVDTKQSLSDRDIWRGLHSRDQFVGQVGKSCRGGRARIRAKRS